MLSLPLKSQEFKEFSPLAQWCHINTARGRKLTPFCNLISSTDIPQAKI